MIDLAASPARRRVLFAALYFGEGAPIGFIWWHLPTELRLLDVPVDRITALTATLALPWALKVAWAPLVDLMRGPRFGLRAWIVAAQLGMVATLMPLLGLDLRDDFAAVQVWLLLHAFCAATQDVAVDAWAIAMTAPAERGRLNGWMQAGMLGGRIAFSAGALAASAAFGLPVVVAALLAAVSLSLVLVAGARSAVLAVAEPERWRQRARRVGAELRAVLARRTTAYAAVIALAGGAGFEAAGALAGSFLVDAGRDQGEVALFWAAAALVAIPGGLLGGRLADRRGATAAARATLLGVAATAGVLALSAAFGPRPGLGELCLCGVYFALGAFTAASYALFMGLAPAAAAATVFSAFMGLTNLCEAWAARLGGILAAGPGYAVAFAVPALLSLLALPALVALGRARSG